MVDLTSVEYAAAYYLWVTSPVRGGEGGYSFAATAERLLHLLIDAGYESVESARRLLEVQTEHPEYPHDAGQLAALERGRDWLRGVLPAVVAESDDVFGEQVAQVRRGVARTVRRGR